MRNSLLFLLIAVFAADMSFLNGCAASSNAAAHNDPITPAPVFVRLATVEHTSADLPVRAVGKLEAKEELRLSFTVGGIMERVLVQEGQKVSKGQLLAALNLTEINARLAQAQNGFDKVDRDLERVKNLFADTVATLEQLQNATTARDVAKAGLDAAEFSRTYAQITAPCDGRVLRRLAEDHEQVSPGTVVLVLAGFEKGWVVKASLADRDLLRVKTGDSAAIEFGALPGTILSGTVSQIGAAPNPLNGTYEIEVRIDGPADRMVSGLIGKITITPVLTGQLSLIPVEALVEANGTSGFVFAPTTGESAVRKVPVLVSYVHEGKAGIRGELPGIQEVVTAGATKLTDGDPITVVR